MADFDFQCPAVQTHINVLQGIISRMGANSLAVKTWCVTLVSAVLVALSAREASPHLYCIALIPTVVFLFVDAEYLALEKHFRACHVSFVSSLASARIQPSDMFVIPSPAKGLTRLQKTAGAIASFAIFPFYLVMVAAIVLAAFYFKVR